MVEAAFYHCKVPLSNYSKDTFIARDMSKFTSAHLPDMSSVDTEQQHWPGNFILNTMFRGSELSRNGRQQLFNFLRRSRSAFESYERAREATLAFLADGQQPLRYLDAIGHWEAFLAYAWQAYELLRGGQIKLFEKRDGTSLDRLNRLHNSAKHAELLIRRGELDDDTLFAVWLTNDGLQAPECHLTFVEIVEILEELAHWADAAQDPATMREKLDSASDQPHTGGQASGTVNEA